MDLIGWIVVGAMVLVVLVVFWKASTKPEGSTESELNVLKLITWKLRSVVGRPGESAGVTRPAAGAGEQPKDPDALKLEHALTLLSEVAEGLVPAVEAPDPWERQRRVAAWLNIYIEGLGSALAVGGPEKYRVGLWARQEDVLVPLAYHLFDPATVPPQLDAKTSVGGHVIQTGQPHYCTDIEKDPVYVPRSRGKRRRSYRSLYAVPLGPQEEPWGALTVDARRVDGFTWVERAIILAFGRVASTGMGMFDIVREQLAEAAADDDADAKDGS